MIRVYRVGVLRILASSKVVSTTIPSDKTKLNNRPERPHASFVIVWVAVIATLSVMAIVLSLSPPTGRDASAFAYVGQGILAGEVPYLDRWDHKGPVTYTIYALGLLASGWWGVWSINLAFLFCSSWLAFKIVDRQFGTTAALFSVATLLIYVMMLGSRLGLTEHYALLFQFLALFLLLRADKTGGPNAWECLGIGALGALSFLLRANLIGVWLAIGIFWTVRWPETRLRIFWSVIGGLSVLVAVSIVFLSLGAWTEFWDATIAYNLIHSDATLSDRIRATMLLVWHLSPVAPLFGVAWCVGIWFHLTGRACGTELDRIWLFALILGPIEVTLSMVSGYGYGHYYIAILPVGTLYLGFLVWFVSKQRLATPVFLTLILLFATVNYRNQRKASPTDASGSFIQDLALEKGGMENGTHHVAPSRDLIGCGDHYVLAYKEIAQRPPNFDRGLALVGDFCHHHKQVNVAPLAGRPAYLGAEEQHLRWLESADDAVHHI